MTTILPDFTNKVAGAGGGKGIPANGPKEPINVLPACLPVITAPKMNK